jgi:hypothetical protein
MTNQPEQPRQLLKAEQEAGRPHHVMLWQIKSLGHANPAKDKGWWPQSALPQQDSRLPPRLASPPLLDEINSHVMLWHIDTA